MRWVLTESKVTALHFWLLLGWHEIETYVVCTSKRWSTCIRLTASLSYFEFYNILFKALIISFAKNYHSFRVQLFPVLHCISSPFPSGKWIESFAYDELHFWPWGWSLLDGDNFNILMMKCFSEMVDHRKCSLWPSQISWHFSSKIWTCAKPKFWFCWMNLFCRLANESSLALFTAGTIVKVLSSFQFAICYKQIPTWSEPLLK